MVDQHLAEDLALLDEGLRLLFVNDYHGAEDLFKSAAQRGPGRPGGRDFRGVFALEWTLVSFLFGVLSFANDQLDECLERVWIAEKLVAEEDPWIGQRIVHGVIFLMAGCVQSMKNSWLKAGVNFMRALRFLSHVEEAITYEGPERQVVRSVGLYLLGWFNFVLSMLPPQVLRVVSRAGGRAMEGDRGKALELLTMCWSEGGLMAPWAAVVLLSYYITIKTFLGETTTAADFDTCQGLLAWGEAKYPGSAIFSYFEGEVLAARQQILAALERIQSVHCVLSEFKMPAVEFFLHQKLAVLHMAVLDWGSAAEGWEASLMVNVAKNRRSWVPFLSYLASLCRLLAGDVVASKAHTDRVRQYAKLRKRNWPPEDSLAFRKVKDIDREASLGNASCALLDVLEVSMLKLHILHTLPDASKRELCLALEGSKVETAELRTDAPASSLASSSAVAGAWACAVDPNFFLAAKPEEGARALLFRAELKRLLGEVAEAKNLAAIGLQLASPLGSRAVQNGTVASLHFTLAVLAGPASAAHLESFDRCVRPCQAYDDALKFKRMGLGKAAVEGPLAALGPTMSEQADACDLRLHGRSLDLELSPGHEVEDEEFFSAEEGQGDEPPAGDGILLSAPSSPTSSKADRAPATLGGSEAADRRGYAAKPFMKGLSKSVKGLSQAIAATASAAAAVPQVASVEALSGQQVLLDALQQQAQQGDCSVVSMRAPERGASSRELQSYLRWAQWSSLRGMSRDEAARQHAELVETARSAGDPARAPATPARRRLTV